MIVQFAVRDHGTEFPDRKRPAGGSQAGLSEDNGSAVLKLDQNRDQQDERRKKDQSQQGKDNIAEAFGQTLEKRCFIILHR